MELSEDARYLDAHWTKDNNGNNEFFIINEAIISKLCILGEDFEPCFEGSTIEAPKIEFSLEDGFKEQLFSMMNEIKNMLNEGGASMETNENIVVEEPVTEEEVVVEEPVVAEEPTVEEPAATEFKEEEDKKDDDEEEEICEECGKPLSECECDKKPTENCSCGCHHEYVLEDIVEYTELQEKYAELETKFNELSSEHDALRAENEDLVSFKLSVEKKEKEAMINSFYMLSEEDKKDVVENIDSYSLEDIEAKLSILCVRNKVSFDLEENKATTEPVNYSLNDLGEGASEKETPDWIKAIQNHVAEN